MAVNNGSVPFERVKDMATRIVASWCLLDQDKNHTVTNFDSWDPLGKGEHIDVRADHYKCVRELSSEAERLSLIGLSLTGSSERLARPRPSC